MPQHFHLPTTQTNETKVVDPIVKESIHEHHVHEVQPIIHKEHEKKHIHQHQDHIAEEGEVLETEFHKNEHSNVDKSKGLSDKIKDTRYCSLSSSLLTGTHHPFSNNILIILIHSSTVFGEGKWSIFFFYLTSVIFR